MKNIEIKTLELKKEIEADKLALEILIPKKIIEKELAHKKTNFNADKINELSTKFKVSKTAMIVRLKDLGYYIPDINLY